MSKITGFNKWIIELKITKDEGTESEGTESEVNRMLSGLTHPDNISSFSGLIASSKTYPRLDKLLQIQKSLCTYAVAATINNLVTDISKNYAGYLRPNFYSACQPNEDYSQCTNTDSSLPMHHFRTSFPSGHASFSFCMFVLLHLFLEQRYGMTSIQRMAQIQGRLVRVCIRPPSWHRLYSVLSLLPVGIAIWVGTSRIVDNWHFPIDVVGGAILGCSVALATHRIWYGAVGIACVEVARWTAASYCFFVSRDQQVPRSKDEAGCATSVNSKSLCEQLL